MQVARTNELTIRGQLKIKRDQLFGKFSRDPSNLHLAIEIRSIDDRIAALRSDDRLAALAARLGMTDPQHFALVELPPAAQLSQGRHLAAFSSLAGMFMPPVGKPR